MGLGWGRSLGVWGQEPERGQLDSGMDMARDRDQEKCKFLVQGTGAWEGAGTWEVVRAWKG